MTPRLVVLAAGGTGGHMFPAQAVARDLLGRGVGVMLVTDRRGAGFGPELEVETHRIAAGGIAGGSPWRKLKSLSELAVGYLQVRSLFRQHRPGVVVGFGGYASVPSVLAGASRGARILLHEQNAVLGRANRLLAARTAILATSFDQVEAVPEALRGRIRITGNPVRPAIAALGRRPFAVPGDRDRLNLLVTGGSQGAEAFNRLVPAAVGQLPAALRQRLRISQQTPGPDWQAVAESYRQHQVESETAPFFEDLAERLAKAHLVICRAGASTVCELASAGRPAILVPYPYATDDHQSANARALAEAGGGWVIQQRVLTPETLAERLQSLLETPASLARAAHCARTMARDRAAADLVDLICGQDRANGGESQGPEPGLREAAA